MKKLIPLWLMMIFSLVIITGCKIQSVEEYNNQTEQEQSVKGASETKIIVKGDNGDVSTKEEIEKDSTIEAKKPDNEEEEKSETKQKELKNEAEVTSKKRTQLANLKLSQHQLRKHLVKILRLVQIKKSQIKVQHNLKIKHQKKTKSPTRLKNQKIITSLKSQVSLIKKMKRKKNM